MENLNNSNKNRNKPQQMKILLFMINYFIGFAKFIHSKKVLNNDLKNEIYSYLYGLISILLEPKYFNLPLNNHDTLLNYIYKDKSNPEIKKRINKSKKRDLIKSESHNRNKYKVLNEQEISENAMIISLIIRVFTVIGYIFMDRNYFDKYLIKMLYPLLDKLSLNIELIKQTTLASLNHMAFINNYASIDDLIINNIDYIIDSISHNLNYSVSKSYFNVSQIKYRLIGKSSRTPQILNAILTIVKEPNIIIPYLNDTIQHILMSLDLLSRNTTSIVKHKTPHITKLDDSIFDQNKSILKLDWKPSSIVYNNSNNKALSFINSINMVSLLDSELNTNNDNTYVTKNDYDYITRKLKQTWQLQCIQEYMMVLYSIINAFVIKSKQNPEFLSLVSIICF